MKGIRNFIVFALFFIVTPFVFSEVTSYWRNLPARLQHAFLFQPVALGYVFATLSEAAGAGIAAFILAIPLTWLVRSRPLLLALFLGLAAAVTILPDLYLLVRFSQVRLVVVQLPALVSFFLLSWFFAVWVTTHLGQRAA